MDHLIGVKAKRLEKLPKTAKNHKLADFLHFKVLNEENEGADRSVWSFVSFKYIFLYFYFLHFFTDCLVQITGQKHLDDENLPISCVSKY